MARTYLDRAVNCSAGTGGGLEHVGPIPAELLDRLPDVVEGSVGGGLARHRLEGAWVPAAGELLAAAIRN